MCGIAGVHRLSNRPIPRLDMLVTSLLSRIEERGRDATGYVAIDDAGGVQLQKASCSAFYFNTNRASIAENARTVLLHTRWATQGKPAFPENNHPVEAGGIYVVHNGHIYNDAAVFQDTGKQRRGQVDSEAIPALVASRGWDALPDCLGDLRGDMAVAMIDSKRPRELLLARGNYSPLYYLKGKDFVVWASTREAILGAWSEVLGTPPTATRAVFMLEGESVMFRDGMMETSTFMPDDNWRSFLPVKTYSYSGGKVCEVTGVRKVSETSLALADKWEDDPMQRCDDCGLWKDARELEEAHTAIGVDWLCASCYAWADEVGALKAEV